MLKTLTLKYKSSQVERLVANKTNNQYFSRANRHYLDSVIKAFRYVTTRSLTADKRAILQCKNILFHCYIIDSDVRAEGI